MLVSFILFTTLSSTFAGFAGSTTNSVNNGNSYGYGYSGSFSGNGGEGSENVPIPSIPHPQFNFGFISSYLDSLRKYHEQFMHNGQVYSYALTSSNPSSNVQAQSSITFVGGGNFGAEQQFQQAAGPEGSFPVPNGQGFHPVGFGGSFSGFDGGASASASIGPGGGHQSAAVYPENPNNPNIATRFGGGEGGNQDPKFYSVFTSSQSSSSNVNGIPQSFHQASTTVNDNGKISTFTVKKP